MVRRNPVITGTGIICATGCGVDRVWDSIRQGRSGLGPLTLFSSPRYAQHRVGQVRENVDALAGPVRGSRTDKLSWIAAREAIESAGLGHGLGPYPPRRAGVLVGSTVGGMLGTEQVFASVLRGEKRGWGTLRDHECAGAADLCAHALGARGPCATVSTACSAGAMAILAAAELITQGEADLMLVGAGDSLSRLTLNGFGSLLLLDPNGCRPFDAHRAGISLGEGAAMLVLESEDSARDRGARILARLLGWGASCDAHHATAPHPEGRGAFEAMQSALVCAGLQPDTVDYVSAHGTGTPDNDAMEARALQRLFGNRLPPVASVMRFLGHTLAASGAIKAALCVRALQEQELPANPGFDVADASIGLEPLRVLHRQSVSCILSNSFGFGGNNVALILGHADVRHEERPGPRERTEPPEAASWTSLESGLSQPTPANPDSGRLPIMEEAQIRSDGAVPILGLGVVSPSGCSMAAIAASMGRGGAATTWREVGAASPATRIRVYACGDFGAEAMLDLGQRRRFSRLQQMVWVAARQGCAAAFGDAATPGPGCVAMGTGLGSLGDTLAFVENLVLKEERAPRPALFSNSVHNALASRIAIELRMTGLNTTFVHREISFEAALWHGLVELRSGRVAMALVGAADELNAHALAAGVRWGWWHEQSPALGPFRGKPKRREQPVPGEGCAMVVLGRPSRPVQPLAWVSAVRMGRHGMHSDSGWDAALEARWILETLERDGVPLGEVDMLLTGANGRPEWDRRYLEVAQALSRGLGRELVCGAYKHGCGEHHSASAFGLVTAVGLVRGEIDPGHCARFTGGVTGSEPCRAVVLLTLSTTGTQGMCCVRA